MGLAPLWWQTVHKLPNLGDPTLESKECTPGCNSQCLPISQSAWLQVPAGPLRHHLVVAVHACVDPHAGHLLAELPQHVVAVAHLPGVSRERRGGCSTHRWAPTKKLLIGLYSLVLLVLLVPCASFSSPLLCLRAAKQVPQKLSLGLRPALPPQSAQPAPLHLCAPPRPCFVPRLPAKTTRT